MVQKVLESQTDTLERVRTPKRNFIEVVSRFPQLLKKSKISESEKSTILYIDHFRLSYYSVFEIRIFSYIGTDFEKQFRHSELV